MLNIRLKRFVRKINNWFSSNSNLSLDVIYLNADLPLIWKPSFVSTPLEFPGLINLRTVEYPFWHIDLVSNASPEKATDLFIAFGKYTYRPMLYIIATLNENTCKGENNADYLSLIFAQIRRNWRQNLFVDNHPRERDQQYPVHGHGWNYTGTGIDLDVRYYVADVKKSALKMAIAYDFVAKFCERYKNSKTEIFRKIARAFEAVARHKIKIPLLSKEEKARRIQLFLRVYKIWLCRIKAVYRSSRKFK
jgi:hypothetical protein